MGKGAKKLDETEQERALAEIAAQRFNRYKEVFAPLEDQYIQQVFDVRDQSNYENAGGIAASQFQREFQTGQDKLSDQMFQQGVDPSSGAFQENSAALRRAQAVGQGIGVSGAKVANTDRFYQGLRGVMAIGQGQSADAIEGMAGLARQSQKNAMTSAEAAFNSNKVARNIGGGILGYAATPFVDSKMKKSQTPQPTFSGTTSSTGG